MPPESERRWGRRLVLERTAPFAIIVVLAFATVPLTSYPADTSLVIVAAVLTVVLAVAIIALPWARLPGPVAVIPPFAGLVIVALLRHAEGGAVSGYGLLALIPVVWLSLYGSRRELMLIVAGVAATFVIPLLVFGAPEYPESDWRRAILASALAAFIGIVTQNLVAEVRERAAEAERRARDEAEAEEYMRAVMDSAAEGIVAIDLEGRATFANPAAARLCGYEVDELIGRRMHDLVHHTRPDGSDYPIEECPVFETLRTGVQRTVSDEVFWRQDGTSFPVEYRATAMVVDGETTGVVNTFLDISDRLAAERAKDDFVSVVSHELRTPLTSIRGSLGLMEGGVVGEVSEEGQQMLAIAISNADRLVRLINDLLDAERIESGKAPMEVRITDLGELMSQTSELLAASASEAGVTLEVTPLKARLLADPDRITQTLVNLIGNAIKFSGEGTTVRVDGEIAGGLARVFIRDQGPGIPPDQHEAIFGRFVQVDSRSDRAKDGTGLGLPIARRIVERHGGRIWIESSGDEGTTFAFELPLARTPEAQPDGAGMEEHASVLILEDDVDLAEVLAASLARHGVRSVSVTTLEGAAEALEVESPALLVLDVDLPGTGPAELIRWLEGPEAPSGCSILVYTALDLSPDELAGLRAHAEVVTKGRVPLRDLAARALEQLARADDGSG
ncbi:MAG TPA: ATP-binding protein [Solirubrobacterales bacterium]